MLQIEAVESFTTDGFFCYFLKIKLFSSILISRRPRIDSLIDKDLFTCLSPKKHFFSFWSLRVTINYHG